MKTGTLHRDSTALPTEFFRLLADTSPVGIALYGRDCVLYVNPAMEVITGYPKSKLLTMSPLDTLHPDDREAVTERLEARLRGERPTGERFEVRFLGPRSEERWVEVAATRIETGDDDPAVLASIVDVTERRRVERELLESRERLDLAQSAARYVTWEWNLESDELLVDDKVEEIYGLTREQVGHTGEEFLNLVHEDDREKFRKVMEATRTGRQEGKFHAEVRFALPGGEVRWVGERARILPAGEGRPARVIGVATDITERKRMELALSEEKERAQITLACIGDGVIRTDDAGRIDYMNVVAERLTGWTLEQALGRPLMDVYRVVDEASRKPLADPLRVCLGQRRVVELPGSSLLVHRQGREYAIQDSAAPVITTDGRLTGAVLVFKDVTHERGMEREVSYLVTHDPLTGLINRHEFERRVGRLLDQALDPGDAGPRHALCYLDLDEFKLINDTCGHLAGDELLQQIADRISALVPPGSTLARLGGDEFGVLLENVSPDDARTHTGQLRDAVRELRFDWQGRPFSMSVSVGLVLLSGHEDSTADILSAADAACHMAKEEGHNSIHEYRPEDAELAERYSEMHWVHRIQKALDEDRFVLHRQRIEPLDGEVPLVEVFIRMRGEDGEIIPPGRFIPAAERFHLIPAVDRWVVRTALRHLAEEDDPDGPRHALNLSGQSLGEEAFLDAVVEELEASGLDPARICFEITETAAVTHLARANRFISVLRRMGCRFILDDFGSGLSSFAYLKNLQVDYLKVSGEFVRGLTVNEVQWALVRSIHELGSLMGMCTIAEGVETEQELEAVRKIGFDYAQGYWIERPRPMGPATEVG